MGCLDFSWPGSLPALALLSDGIAAFLQLPAHSLFPQGSGPQFRRETMTLLKIVSKVGVHTVVWTFL